MFVKYTFKELNMAKRILLLTDISSSHTEKWVRGLSQQGYVVAIYSLNPCKNKWYNELPNVYLLSRQNQGSAARSLLQKLSYIFEVPKIRAAIREFKPDILHAHYASSYGLLGALSRFKPFIISVWGSDVYEFPNTSFIHRAILKFNLKKAERILSTSYAMKGELWKYTKREIEVLPFGVDTDLFSAPSEKNTDIDKPIRLGVIKAMEDIYGIKTVIEALHLVSRCLPEQELKLYLIGGGTQVRKYKKIASKLGLRDKIVFTGKIPFREIAEYHKLMDVLINVSSVNESFGVSVVESMACEKAVIVSNVPGLKEVIDAHGIIVEKDNAAQLTRAIIQLIESPELRIKIGKAARAHVLQHYDFKNCLLQLTGVYDSLLSEQSKHESSFPLISGPR